MSTNEQVVRGLQLLPERGSRGGRNDWLGVGRVRPRLADLLRADDHVAQHERAAVTSSLLCECGERASGQELVEPEDLTIEDAVG